jgi:5-enolpyruvylshikimate-3-phosphate synthase
MSDWMIEPANKLSGELFVPADKSITHRAIMLSSVAEGCSVVRNYLPSGDCMATLQAFGEMGVKIESTPETLTIHGAGFGGLKAPGRILDAGNSGTTVRLFVRDTRGPRFFRDYHRRREPFAPADAARDRAA